MRWPTIASSPGSIIQTPIDKRSPVNRVNLDAGCALAQFLDHAPDVHTSFLVVPGDSQVRHRVGDLGHEDLGPDVREFFEGLGDATAT